MAILQLLAFCLLLPVAVRSDVFSTYSSFVKCMQNRTSPGDNIGSLILYSANSTFPSVLKAYIRNTRFDTTTTPKPLLIVTAKQVSHLQATVICAQKAAPGYTVKIRSGGHDYDGLSYTSTSPFLMVDMFNLRSISVDPASKTAWVQAGATLGEVYYQIWKTSNLLGYPAGVCPTVGVGGHISGGGYGNLLRKYGLSVDNVEDALVVDAKGRLLNRASMGEDFFWAIRGGGGGSFGIVVAYKINLVSVPATVTVFRVDQLAENNASAMFNEWQKISPGLTDDLFLRALVQQAPSIKVNGGSTVSVSIFALYLGGADSLVKLVNEQLPSLKVTAADCKEMTWIQSVLWWAILDPAKNSPTVLLDRNVGSSMYQKLKSDYVTKPMTVQEIEGLFTKMVSINNMVLAFNTYGGKMSQIPSSALPFPHRAGKLFKIQYFMYWNIAGDAVEKDNLNRSRQLYSFMTPYVSQNPRSAFLNYRDIDIGVMPPGTNSVSAGRVYGEKYFNANFDRLVKIKTAVDPKNFFRNEQSIPTM